MRKRLLRIFRRAFPALLFAVFFPFGGCLSPVSPASVPEEEQAGISAGEMPAPETDDGEARPFTLPGMGRAFVIAVPNPVIFWEPGGGKIQVQVSRSAEFTDGALLLDAETADSSMRLNLDLDESSVLFLRARPVKFLGGEWTPVTRISCKPLDIAMRPVQGCEMAVYEVTNELLAEIINRLVPGGEIVLSGEILRGKDGTPYLGLGELNYGFQFGLELLRDKDHPEMYTLAPRSGRADHPAVGLSWYGAAFICDCLSRMFGYRPAYARIASGVTADAQSGGFRMPSEAEWDYAARGPDAFVYPGGAKTLSPGSANYLRSGDPFEARGGNPAAAGGPTNPVNFYDGTEKNGYRTANGVSPSGLYDMLGNVWEWCDDLFVEEAGGGAENAGAGENAGAENSPPATGRFHVVRGGAWNVRRENLSLKSRGWYKAEGFSYSLGLRLARTP
jgi:formylglycine-generating enzyme required for sulfatase activity